MVVGFFRYAAATTSHAFVCIRTRNASTSISLSRSYLYVPSASERMLEKSLKTPSDVIVYDLEDSVPPGQADKLNARSRLKAFLQRPDIPEPTRIAVRVNDLTTPFFGDDIAEIVTNPAVRSLVLPKVHSAQDLHHVSRQIHIVTRHVDRPPISLIPSIESARALWNIGEIASWKSEYAEGGGTLSALLFAAEDYCADTSIIRSRSRQELLYTRSQIVIAARAFGLSAIDMVCINYQDNEYLEQECRDGRELGFSGKQAIHPNQVPIIQSIYVPTSKEIFRAAKILHQMDVAHSSQKGAIGLEGEMIDAPMIKQAEKTITLAKAAGLEIPTF
ncbi:hypothetical protein HGRIS_013243 [Hohenbuehelia grisea]|uniref:HpcH/HpaI aldolase/citrate lyase domain-containing protein n=1 Tax=Hohenbuehelia grisea TaxID=104357 RepID=A0ABR3IUT4_9AGAR